MAISRRLLLLLGACGAGLSALTGCGGGSSDAIPVGEFASLTGKEATFGISSHEGTELAIEEINAAGGVLGKKLKLITEDDQSKAGEPANVVNKLISKDGVVAVLGEVASSRSMEAGPICQDAKIPMISPASTNPKVTETGDYIFRVCFTDVLQGKVLSNFAKNTLKANRVAIFTDVKSDYSKGLAKYFKDAFLAAGGQVVAELDYNGGDKDFKSPLTAIKSAAPDAVFVPGYYTDVALICIQAKQLGLALPFFGGDGWESDVLLKIGGESMNGHYFSTHSSVDSPDPAVKTFVESYKKRYNKTPDAMAMLGYDSAKLLADAIKRAGSTEGPKIREQLAATKDFPGVTGKITIDEKRDATKAMVILKIENGAFKLVESVNP